MKEIEVQMLGTQDEPLCCMLFPGVLLCSSTNLGRHSCLENHCQKPGTEGADLEPQK